MSDRLNLMDMSLACITPTTLADPRCPMKGSLFNLQCMAMQMQRACAHTDLVPMRA